MNVCGRRCVAAGLLVLGATIASEALAWGSSPAFGSPFGYVPRVPVSAFARPAAWFDPSRLSLSTSVSVGGGFGGGTSTLQVTSLSYRFRAPVWMNVSVGNAWGASSVRGSSSLFLEGVDLGYRPFSSLMVQIHYRDFRSPLQLYQGTRPLGWGE